MSHHFFLVYVKTLVLGKSTRHTEYSFNCIFRVISCREYEGEYDNLLYLFVFQYNLIQEEKAKR